MGNHPSAQSRETGQHERPKRLSPFNLSQMSYSLTIGTGNIQADEYRQNLHEAITEALKLAFLVDEITLTGPQTFALHVLNDFLQRLVKKE